jgi:predicted phosphodiesterase
MADNLNPYNLNRRVSHDLQQQVLRLHGQGMPLRDIARELFPADSVSTAYRWIRSTIAYNRLETETGTRSTDPIVTRANTPLADQIVEVEGDLLIMSDLHVPYHDAELIDTAIRHAQDMDIRQWLIVGDLMDGNQWSRRGLNQTYQRRWQDDAEIAQSIIAQLVEHVGPGTVLMGNHDAWFVRHFKGQAETEWLLSRLFRTGENVLWSMFEQCRIKSGGREIRATHGANYSGANPLGVGQRLAAKWECSVVMGHQHHATHGLSWSGRHQIVCMGGMHDPRKLAYIHEAPRTNPAQTRSYVILTGGNMDHVIADAWA